jgi:phenylacetate-CoA ligase
MEFVFRDPFIETLRREVLVELQLKRLQLDVLQPVLEGNDFYRRKLISAGVEHWWDIQTREDLQNLPFTNKAELSEDQVSNPRFGSNLTYPEEKYIRLHQTSGTTGEPLLWLDTRESWDWWARCWATVYRAAGVTPQDRIFFAFSFGPFIGFWSAYEGARKMNSLAIPGGGMSSYQRAKSIIANEISVLVCTPTYALHLAEVAEEEGLDIAKSNVRISIHAGEPGASLPGTKRRIEDAWGARCYDHVGATEVGAWGFECQASSGVHVNEGEFICEVIDPETEQPADEGELVITNLGRAGMPLIRYRTGDRVKANAEPCACGRSFLRFEGGVIGRIDGALNVRGINIFPSAIENIIRRFPEIGEFAVNVRTLRSLDEMGIEIELKSGDPDELTAAVVKGMRDGVGLRVTVQSVPVGTLPRFDMKAKRFTDHRKFS